MGYKGAFCGAVLRKCRDGIECRQTEQRMKQKIAGKERKVNVEEKATQRGVLAYITWSIERQGVRHRPIQLAVVQNHVKDFRGFFSGIKKCLTEKIFTSKWTKDSKRLRSRRSSISHRNNGKHGNAAHGEVKSEK